MGELCYEAGLSEKLYRAAYKWVGRFRGGLSMATVLACGAFSAVSGSSLATAATMGAVSLPEMKRYKYADTLATGSIAAGGTIGILIPPSVMLIIYGILTEVSIAELFFAGILPGLLSLLYYVFAIIIWTRVNPEVGPVGPRFSHEGTDKIPGKYLGGVVPLCADYGGHLRRSLHTHRGGAPSGPPALWFSASFADASPGKTCTTRSCPRAAPLPWYFWW